MELQEMKSVWEEMSQKIDEQNILTDKLVTAMIQKKYTNRFNKILIFESIGSLICFSMALFLIINFRSLETWYLMLCGLLATVFLIVMPILTLKSIGNIKSINLSTLSYKDNLRLFYKSKSKLLKLQKTGVYFSFIFAFLILPVTSKLMNNQDLFLAEYRFKLFLFVPVLIILMILISRWGMKGYKNVTNSAENILNELDQ